MRKIIAALQASVDGFIEGQNGVLLMTGANIPLEVIRRAVI